MRRHVVGGMLVVLATLAAAGSSVESQEYARLRAFEIQGFPANKGPWFEAAYYCALKEGGRLCQPSEWVAACRAGYIKPSGAPEWVDALAPEEPSSSREGLRALALIECSRGVWRSPREILPMRCCRNRGDTFSGK